MAESLGSAFVSAELAGEPCSCLSFPTLLSRVSVFVAFNKGDILNFFTFELPFSQAQCRVVFVETIKAVLKCIETFVFPGC